MGRYGTPQLGYMRDDDDRDIPELNKCPNCEAFFEGDICPVCKTVCPEEMKAGNRVAPKKKKRKKEKPLGYKVPLPIYQQTWFIILMLFISKIVGVFLVWASEWKRWVKITVTIIALGGGYIISFILFPLIGSFFTPEAPLPTELVNYSVSESEYRQSCEAADYNELMRNPAEHMGDFVKAELTVSKVTSSEHYIDGYIPVVGDFWLCVDGDGRKYIVFDCRKKSGGVISGDVVTVFAEFAGTEDNSVFFYGVNEKLPLFYAAYTDIISEA